MTPDNEFFLVIGGCGVLLGALVVGGLLLLLSRRADTFEQMADGNED